MALQISIGYTNDDYRVINKSVTYVVNAVGCKVIHPNDIVNPTLELEYNSSYDSCNYAYLPEFHRYYYIENESDLPNDNGNYWHYVNGVPTVWVKE